MSAERNLIEQTFNKPKVFLPVIHLPRGRDGAMESISTAYEADADGIFLINQGMRADQVVNLIPQVKSVYPDLWVGINLLGYSPEDVMLAKNDVEGIWADNAGVDLDIPSFDPEASFREAKQWSFWKGLYFGGTAFKTQREVPFEKLAQVAQKASRFVDVVTTSGRGTGIAADVARVAEIRRAIGDHPLALASGVTPENVSLYLPLVDAYLVATGIEERFGVLNPQKTRLLSERIHNFKIGQ